MGWCLNRLGVLISKEKLKQVLQSMCQKWKTKGVVIVLEILADKGIH